MDGRCDQIDMTYSDVLRNDTLSTYLHKGSQAPLTVSFTMVDMSSRSCRAFPVPRNSPSQGPPQVTGSEDVFLPGGRVHCNGISGVEPRPRAPKTDATNTAVPLNHGTTCRCNTHDGHRGNNNNPAPPSQRCTGSPRRSCRSNGRLRSRPNQAAKTRGEANGQAAA